MSVSHGQLGEDGRLQVVKRGHKVAHKSHEKERHLEDVFADKVEAFDDGIIPGDRVERVNEREGPEKEANSYDLQWSSESGHTPWQQLEASYDSRGWRG